ncbi:hypothetical protein UFOVP144_46 [uncultured Caudovirales phage]|uniref:Uncharacterized protein n=1 Tax=uncultured Caudovirales phage TaxID=2100421 RepID=A0A6J7XPB5_9CAUD|nr:hypothetical protein UFOVP144_46 [uncultured Caudovirales phage]
MQPDSRKDKLTFYTETPDVVYLRKELERSLYNGGNVARLNSNDDIRLARWDGQSDDGKKYSYNSLEGESVFPFEGASDVRCRLVDQTINELVVLLCSSWQLARLRVAGTEYNDAGIASSIQNFSNWLINNRMKADLTREAELLAQYTMQFGWCVSHIGWETKLGVRNKTLTIGELQSQAMSGDQIAGQLLNTLQTTGVSDLTKTILIQAYSVSEKEAERVASELSISGVSTFREQYNVYSQPAVAALKPFDEIAFPPETLDLQDARVIFRRTHMTEVEMRELIETDGWDENFVEEASTVAGKSSWYADPNLIPTTTNITNTLHRADNLIEIVYAYTRQINEDGVPCIYYTVFCPQVRSELFAKHAPLEYAHGQYPFVEFRREQLRRSIIESRGVPEIAYTDQLEIKAQHDSIRDRTAFETLPPIKVKKRLGTQNIIQPGGLLPVTTPDDYTFLAPPQGNPALAFNLIDRVEARNAAYFGLYHATIPPVKTQTTQQFLVNNWLGSWSKIFKQIVSLALQYTDGSEIERVAGMPIVVSPNEICHAYDFNVSYNVKELDTDYVLEKLKAISSFVVPMDAGGVIDRNKLTARFIEAISPEAAKDILLDQASASQKMYEGVQNDIAKMMLGIEVQYTENDPAAKSKLQYAQDIIQKNQKAQQAAQADPQFQALIQNYFKNLQMSVSQQDNKTIGRLGVTPVSDKFNQQQTQAPQGGQPGF